MRLYEVVYIFDASLDEARVSEKLERFHGVLAGDGKGEVAAVDHWGARQLAYPIDKKKTGYYVVVHVHTDPESLPEFERLLKLDDEVMRYLVVLNEGEATSGMSILKPRPPGASQSSESSESEESGQQEFESPPEFSGGQGRRRRIDGPSIQLLNYKDVATLSRFMTEQGKILPKRTTKVSARFQRRLGRAIKRARYLALVPYVRLHEG